MASSEANHLAEVAKKFTDEAIPGTTTGSTFTDGRTPYAARYFARTTAEDKLKDLHDAALLADKMHIGRPTFDDSLIALSAQKKRELDLINFDRFLEKAYDQTDPAESQLLEKLYPEYQKKRVKYIEERYELAKTCELLKLRGPQSKQDLVLMYLFASGEMKIPTLKDDVETNSDAAIKRGMFNYRRYFGDKAEVNVTKPAPFLVGNNQKTSNLAPSIVNSLLMVTFKGDKA